MINFFRECYRAIRYGEWVIGWENWKGKPRLAIVRLFYDGWHVCLHIGPFYLGVYYW